MKILLIGHSIIDHIDETGIEISRPGGLYYSAMGMLAVKNEETDISLITGWNDKSFYLFDDIYTKTDMAASAPIDEMPEVFLKTSGGGEREEHYLNISSNLSLDGISDWNRFDGILINMITGFDITLEQLKNIRKNFSGTIYLDIHTLSRGVDKDFTRKFRPIPEVSGWLANIDILQCNVNELHTIVGNVNEMDSASEILDHGVKTVIVTQGDNGVNLYRKKDSTTLLDSIEAVKIESRNKVGCGDIFGAVFFYSYISTGDLRKSLFNGNLAGALAASSGRLTLKSFSGLNDK
jgi:hypothetical protein